MSVIAASLFAVGVGSSSAATPTIVAISAGQYHTCALTSTGGVKCWGDNTYGQLGDGTTTMRSTPVDVSGLTSGVAAISAGQYHTCALMSSGGMKCWGYNALGALGDGSTTNRLTPVDVSGMTSGVAAISAGYFHSCAVTSTGGAKCWGYNVYGQLGDGTNTMRSTPVDVSGMTSGVTGISAGQYHTCAVTSAGAAKCWGYNGFGSLGDGTVTNHSTAVGVSGLASGVTTVSAGAYHTCARTSGGGAMCWGYNGSGQLGDGTTTSRPTPVDVSGLTAGVNRISAGQYHTCVQTTAGGVKCWGYNGFAGLGDGTTTGRLTPVDVTGLTSGANAVSAGGYHTCALTTLGGVKCWGYNSTGQVGDGTTTTRSTPQVIFADATAIAPTKLTVNGAAGEFAHAASVSAKLTNASTSAPVTGKLLTFTLNNNETCTALTDVNGNGACSLTPAESASSYELDATFAGDADFAKSSGSAGFVVDPAPATVTYTGPVLIGGGAPATLSAMLSDDKSAPIAGRAVMFTLGSDASAQSCSATTDASGNASCVIPSVVQPVGPGSVAVAFDGDGFYQSAGDTDTTLVFDPDGHGMYVVGDKSATGTVTFWGAQWAKANNLSGGSAPADFKGLETSLGAPTCGSAWTTTPSASSTPPGAGSTYTAVVVSSSISRSGSTISGNVVHIVIVKTDAVHPANAATGTVVAQLC